MVRALMRIVEARVIEGVIRAASAAAASAPRSVRAREKWSRSARSRLKKMTKAGSTLGAPAREKLVIDDWFGFYDE